VEGGSGAVGQEWLIDASGCRPQALRDVSVLQRALDALVFTLGLTAIGDTRWHTFPGEGGITGLLMLSESHVAIHTFPEHGFAALSVYSCRTRPSPDFEALLSRHLEPKHVRVTQVERRRA
jgi:S-adenosylmethionine decarboxylase